MKVKRGTRNYEIEYLEYLEGTHCILKLKSGKKLLIQIIA